jgi:hypothetical protein
LNLEITTSYIIDYNVTGHRTSLSGVMAVSLWQVSFFRTYTRSGAVLRRTIPLASWAALARE